MGGPQLLRPSHLALRGENTQATRITTDFLSRWSSLAYGTLYCSVSTYNRSGMSINSTHVLLSPPFGALLRCLRTISRVRCHLRAISPLLQGAKSVDRRNSSIGSHRDYRAVLRSGMHGIAGHGFLSLERRTTVAGGLQIKLRVPSRPQSCGCPRGQLTRVFFCGGERSRSQGRPRRPASSILNVLASPLLFYCEKGRRHFLDASLQPKAFTTKWRSIIVPAGKELCR